MIMRYVIIFIAVVVSNMGLALPQPTKELKHALSYGAKIRIVLSVVDDEGSPVEDARVQICFSKNPFKNRGVKGKTNKTGMFAAEGKTHGEMDFTITKNGHYSIYQVVWIGGTIEKPAEVKDDRWLPFERKYTLVLKRHKQPITLIEHMGMKNMIPTNTIVGYDIKVGDFIKPYGNGEVVDFNLEFSYERPSTYRYRTQLKVTFPNQFDGYYRAKRDVASELSTCYSADTNAIYKKEVKFEVNDLVKGRTKRNVLAKDEYIVLRTRTRINEHGNLISAHYSKILGEWEFDWRTMALHTYFNENENSSNLEHSITESRIEVLEKRNLR